MAITGRVNQVRKRASINDVAKAAGVALGTVSNVLNRPERVAEETRDRVLKAIEELNFIPSAAARQLRQGTIKTVGAVLLDIGNPFFTEIARGIEDRLAEAGFTLMLASSDSDATRETKYLQLYEEHGVHGLLVCPATTDIAPLLELQERGTRVVLVDIKSPTSQLPSVAVDDVLGGRMATEHLLSLGHEKIVFVNGPLSIHQCADRRRGVHEALINAGLSIEDSLIEVSVNSLDGDGGSAAIEQVIEDTGGKLPPAVFCVNDLTALGVMRTLRARGYDIPGDVAIVGYDDVDFASMLSVPLTSIRQPMHKLGYVAADQLLAKNDFGAQILFQPELVVRESSAGRN